MSINLCLVKGSHCDYESVYQTPTNITKEALKSKDTTQYYKNWVLEQRQGKFAEETKEHFQQIELLLSNGYVWSSI